MSRKKKRRTQYDSKRKDHPYAAIVVLLIFSSLIALLGAAFLKAYFSGTAYKKECTAVAAGVVDSVSTYRENYRDSKGKRRTRTINDVTYSFEANGEKYKKSVTVYNINITEGKKLVIHYDPDDPDINYLEKYDDDEWLLLLVGIVFAGLGVFLAVCVLIAAFRPKNKNDLQTETDPSRAKKDKVNWRKN
ncbi:MAG: DUF3592 domain-containing protein [Ruminococcus sp.]|nr:DUF3592 domain-containing protein [Ruminococcus sp.]